MAGGASDLDDSFDHFGEGQVVLVGSVLVEFNRWSLTSSSMEPRIP